jgi:hypothetical protein
MTCRACEVEWGGDESRCWSCGRRCGIPGHVPTLPATYIYTAATHYMTPEDVAAENARLGAP